MMAEEICQLEGMFGQALWDTCIVYRLELESSVAGLSCTNCEPLFQARPLI